MPLPVQVILLAVLALGVGYVWYLEGRGRWRAQLETRFIYGVPWGTLATVVGIVGFYLFAQSGLHHWDDPATIPFRSWSYFYPTGLLLSGFAHASPGHLISNMAGTVVLAPIAEYAWGHYPPAAQWTRKRDLTQRTASGGLLNRPVVRAFVLFPLAVLFLGVVTGALALGWSLGFSGAVFAIGGFTLVVYPLTTIIGMAGIAGVSTVVATLLNPVLRAGSTGTPGPPAWATVNVQAHMLGFLIGVLIGLTFLNARDRSPSAERIFGATLLFVLARQLWAFSVAGGGETYIQYRGLGVVFALIVTVLITGAVAASDRPFPRLLSILPRAPSRGQLAVLWLGLLVGAGGALSLSVIAAAGSIAAVIPVIAVLILLALPAVLPDQILPSPVTRRQLFVIALISLTVVVALPSVVSNVPVVGPNPVPGNGSVTVADYEVRYAEDAIDGRRSGIRALPIDDWGSSNGIVVVSDDREIWTTPVSQQQLAHQGNATIQLGGVGWRESVRAERTGWQFPDSGTVYAVDLVVNGERTRSYESLPVQSYSQISNATFRISPAADEFLLEASRDNETIGSTPIPTVNESATISEFQFDTRRHEETVVIFVEHQGTQLLLAERETF